MKIVCTKGEFAEILTHCVENKNSNTGSPCLKCALYEACQGAYVDTLTSIIEVSNYTASQKS